MRSCLLSAAALLAVASAVQADEPPKPKMVTKVFSVADLVTPLSDFGDMETMLSAGATAQRPKCRKKPATISECGENLTKLVTGMVRPHSWNTMDGPGSVDFFEIGCALVVKNSPDVVQEVSDLLDALGRLQQVAVCSEVRLVKVPAGFCERLGLKATGEACLTECELTKLLEAAQGHGEASVTQFPRVTTFTGQTATVRNGDQRTFVTGVEATRVKGTTVLVPKNTAVDLGDTLALCGQVSADGKYVKVRVNLTRTQLATEKVELVPVVTQVAPVFEGGSQGKPVPFTQYIQAPDVQTRTIEKTVMVPCGGTIVLGGWKEKADCPVLSKVPHVGQVFKTVGPAGECEVIALATVRVVRGECGEKPAPAPAPADEAKTIIKLRNVAAADAAQAVTKFLDGKQQRATIACDDATNAIYLSAEPAVRQQVVKLVAAMDVAPTQVLIQAVVIEVPAGFLGEIGMTDDGAVKPVLALTKRELSMFQAHIRAAHGRGVLDILSRPQLCVADNQTGFFQVGQNYPYATTSKIDGNGTATRKVEYQHVGLSLRVTPRVGPEGKVLLRAEPTFTTVSPSPVDLGNGVKVPAFNTQTMQTTVLASDGETVILRGLTDCRDRCHPDDGPFTALTKKAVGPVRREVLVILTPQVVREPQPAPAVVPVSRSDAAIPPRAPAPPLPTPVVPPRAPGR